MSSVEVEFEKWWDKLAVNINKLMDPESIKKIIKCAFIAGETSGLNRAVQELRRK